MGVNRVKELNKCAAGRAVALGVLLYGYVLAVNSQLKVFRSLEGLGMLYIKSSGNSDRISSSELAKGRFLILRQNP